MIGCCSCDCIKSAFIRLTSFIYSFRCRRITCCINSLVCPVFRPCQTCVNIFVLSVCFVCKFVVIIIPFRCHFNLKFLTIIRIRKWFCSSINCAVCINNSHTAFACCVISFIIYRNGLNILYINIHIICCIAICSHKSLFVTIIRNRSYFR